MKPDIPKISVLIICYNQEKVISRAIESLLKQKDYIYEICVSDDCSKDRTWDILQEYDKMNPGLFKLNRNNPNLGIFENIEKTWEMPTGDIIYRLSGDDECGDGWFKTVVDFIQRNGIDYKKELFCVYGDFKAEYPSGDSIMFRNKVIGRFPNDAVRLALRGLLSNHGCCYSINVLKSFKKVSQGRSHIAEKAQDIQEQCYADTNYYIQFVSNIYHAGIGVSVHLDEETLNVRKQISHYAEKFLESEGILISSADKYYGKYMREIICFRFHPQLLSFFKIIWYYIRGFDIRYVFWGDNTRHCIFAIRRRMPHNKPISFK